MLERSQNFAPDGVWETKDSRQRHVLAFIEMRHYLALARQYGDVALAKRITDANHFEAPTTYGSRHVCLTRLSRRRPPLSKIGEPPIRREKGGARSGSPTSSGRRTVEGTNTCCSWRWFSPFPLADC